MPSFTRRAVLATAAAALPVRSLAQPAPPLLLVVPFPPGGTVDLVARLLQPALAEELRRPVVVENRGGAGGLVGTASVARAAPDGNTAVLVFDTHAVHRHLVRQMPFDADRALDPVSLLVTSPMALVASNRSGITSVADVVSRARARPGALTYATVGRGSSNHLAGLLFQKLARVEMLDVVYRGGGPAVNDVVGGQVDLMFVSLPLVTAHIRGGTMRGLGVGAPRRLAGLPDLPAIAETLPAFEAFSWVGLLLPAGTPAPAKDGLMRALSVAMARPELRSRLEEQGFAVEASAPAAFAALLARESARWGEIIREYDITND